MPILVGYLLASLSTALIRRFIREKVYFVKQLTGICWISCENFPLKYFWAWAGQLERARVKFLAKISGQGLVILPNCRHTCRERPTEPLSHRATKSSALGQLKQSRPISPMSVAVDWPLAKAVVSAGYLQSPCLIFRIGQQQQRL